MNAIDIVLLVVIGAAVAFAVAYIIKNRKKGGCGSCGGCGACPSRSSCELNSKKPDEKR